MKKKILSLTLATAMMMTCMTGCGDKETDSKDTTAASTEETTTEASTASDSDSTGSDASAEVNTDLTAELTVLTHRTDLVETTLPEYAAAFNEKYPNVTVKFEAMEDYEGDVSTRLSTGDYGDVFMIPSTIPVAEYEDFLEPLGTVDELKSTYMEEFLYKVEKDGTVYGLASGANISNGLVYNKKVFEQAGITEFPTTPEEFLEALQLIKDKTDAIPLYTNTHDAWTMNQWQSSVSAASGDSTYVNDIMCNEEDPFSEGKPSYTVYKILYDAVANGLTEEDPFTTEWEGSKLMMAKGEIGCMVLGSWALGQIQEVGADAGLDPADVSYMPVPVSNADGEISVGASGDTAWGINVNSENKEAARAFLDFMMLESGYAVDNGEMSIAIGDEFPEALANFEGYSFLVDSPSQPENAGKWDAVHNESELGLWSGSEYQVMIVEAAFGNVDKSFDDIMAEWNAKWKEALETVNADWE